MAVVDPAPGGRAANTEPGATQRPPLAHLGVIPNKFVSYYDPRLTASAETIGPSDVPTVSGEGFAPNEPLQRWLIRPDGTKSWVWDYFHGLLTAKR